MFIVISSKYAEKIPQISAVSSFGLCGSRKYPYPHHGGKFTKNPPTSPDFPFFQENGYPPPLWIFHKYDKNPPPLWKIYFFGNKMFKNRKHKYSGCVLLRPPQTRKHCCGNIVVSLVVSPFARTANICCGNIFCFRETKNVSDFFQKHFVSSTNVSSFARRENNVSPTLFSCLRGPLRSVNIYYQSNVSINICSK